LGNLFFYTLASDTPGDLEVIGSSICDRGNNMSSSTFITSGKTVRVTTGASLPQGADAVVPVEDTLLLREADDVSNDVNDVINIIIVTASLIFELHHK